MDERDGVYTMAVAARLTRMHPRKSANMNGQGFSYHFANQATGASTPRQTSGDCIASGTSSKCAD